MGEALEARLTGIILLQCAMAPVQRDCRLRYHPCTCQNMMKQSQNIFFSVIKACL